MYDGIHLFRHGVADAELLDLRCHVIEVEVATRDFERQGADALHEGLRGGSLRMEEYLLRCAILVDAAVIHEEDSVTDVVRKAHLVGDDDHGHLLLCQRAYDTLHLADHSGVEGGCRLVEKDDFRSHGEGACDGGTLFLSAGEFGRHRFGFLCQLYLAQEFHAFLLGLFTTESVQLHGGQCDVAKYGKVIEEVVALEHHTHLLAELMDRVVFARDVLSVDKNLA